VSTDGPYRATPARVVAKLRRHVVSRIRAPAGPEIVVTQWSHGTTTVRRLPHFGVLVPFGVIAGVMALASVSLHLDHVLELGGVFLALVGGSRWFPWATEELVITPQAVAWRCRLPPARETILLADMTSFVVVGSPAKLMLQHGRSTLQIFIDEPVDSENKPRLDEEALRWIAQQLRDGLSRARARAD